MENKSGTGKVQGSLGVAVMELFCILRVVMATHIYVCGVCGQSLSCVQLFAIPYTAACQAPLSIEFSRQEYRSGLTSPTPGNLPNPEIHPASLVSPALAGRFFTTAPSRKPTQIHTCDKIHRTVCSENT